MAVSKTAKDILASGLLPEHLKDSSFMFFCVTHKLVDRVMDRYPVVGSKGDHMPLDDKLQILYTAQVNPEPLMLSVNIFFFYWCSWKELACKREHVLVVFTLRPFYGTLVT
jgi:hypothetical protein